MLQESVRDVATRLLPKLFKKLRKFTNAAQEGDAEGIHDLRVGLKRFREGLRLWRVAFHPAKFRIWLRRVETLNDALGEVRDPEVLRQLLLTQEALPDPALLDELAAEGLAAHTRLAGLLTTWQRKDWFHKLARFIRNPKSFRSAADLPHRPFAVKALQTRIRKSAAAWAAVRQSPSPQNLHTYRIANKHLRYALEPFRDELPGLQVFYESISGFHDILGDLHDCDVLLLRLETVALQSSAACQPAQGPLLAGIFTKRLQHFEALHIARERFELMGGYDEMSKRIRVWEKSRENGAAIEREHKFLLRALPPLPASHRTCHIRQGYLATGDPEERVRRIRCDGEEHFFHTLKRGEGESRKEFEEEIDKSLYRKLWRQTRGHRIRKIRHVVPDGMMKWEIDQYLGRKWVIAEVEYETAEPPAPPDWLAPYIQQDVTGNRAYFNKVLAF